MLFELTTKHIIYIMLCYCCVLISITMLFVPSISLTLLIAEIIVSVLWALLFGVIYHTKYTVLNLKNVIDKSSIHVGDRYFQEMASTLYEMAQPDQIIIGRLTTINNKAHISTHYVWNKNDISSNITYELNGTPCNDVLGDLPYLLIENNVSELYNEKTILTEFGASGYAGYPLYDHNNNKNGILMCMWKRPVKLRYNISQLLHIFSLRAAVELERHLMGKALEYKSNHDSLTQLPSRSYMMEQLSQFLQKSPVFDTDSDRGADLYLIDLDDFKEVNDKYGHHVGDELLQEVSTRLQSVVREVDTVSRFGGDEFVILKRSSENPVLFAERIIEQFSTVYSLSEGLSISVTGSVGAVSIPKDSKDPSEALCYADFAMYTAKNLGKNKYLKFTHELYRNSKKQKAMRDDLSLAISNNELEIYVQPIMKVSDVPNQWLDGEVLCRWKYKEVYCSPAIFIKLAEDQGMIHQLGKLVFSKACEYCSDIYKQTGIRATLSVNCAIEQLRDTSFAKYAIDTAKKYNLSPSQIVVEITESSIFESDLIETTMIALNDYGFKTAIDDFGSGYSGLSYIGNVPVSKVKLDRSFITGIDTDIQKQKVVTAIATMCKAYNYQIVAEGVETQQELDFIISAGYDYVQGYIYSFPLTTTEFMEHIKESRK